MIKPIASASRILGKGLALVATDPGEDIGLDIAFAGRDLAWVSGHDALTQDLRVALCTGLGTDPLSTGFGSDAFAAMAEETDTLMQLERIRVAIIRVLRSDPRISRIVEVRINGEPRPFAAERTTSLSITAVFETTLRDFATITVEGLPDA
ncbi:hypothetical protein [Sinorhizobium meliloti]|uniref:IraD/Gp25-like domain-containing protein n=1 Tax=Rhizobium meliloti TaxID=382 RepID=A0A2J0YTD7_RHIML|nr:hypothetical protein [Sinorhizobium meliloti]PJR08733.1 hypothetical protein CEJ86_32455 [Sinorhizobium meliloti]